MWEITVTVISLILAVVVVSISSLYSQRKEALLYHIKELLNHLRTMDSWDDRSELKLFQWMGESDEGTLHYRNLLELRNILNGLYSYWAVHISMEEDISPDEIIRGFNKQAEKWSLKFIIKELFFPDKPRLLI